jgi:cell division septation protein DedD
MLAGPAAPPATRHNMVTLGTPYKTPEGVAELSARTRGLTQRHRTLLLLVDGQRGLDQVLSLAQQAGVPRAYIDELVALGLVVVPMTMPDTVVAAAAPAASAVVTAMAPSLVPRPLPAVMPAALPAANSSTPDVEFISDFLAQGPGAGPAEPEPGPDADEEDDLNPWNDSESFGRALSTSELAALDSSDQSLAEARNLLLQALRQEAPVAGAVTMLRVRRARNRETLVALLAEVEQKIGNQRHLADAGRIIRRVRELLAV